MSIDLVIQNMVGYEAAMHFEAELRALNRWGDNIHDGVIVAIGSYRGQADCAIALHAHVPVYCIDPREGWESEPRAFGDVDRPFWMQNILSLGLAAKVRPIELPSQTVAAVWDKPVGFLWIDGNHVQVEDDLNAWLLHVIDGGLVALHDNNSPHIIEAVTNRDDLVEIERANLTTFYRKEPLHEPHTYDDLTLLVRKGPYNHDDKYVLGEVRSYDIGTDPVRTCIDVGGMIGAFTAWVKQKWPESEIVVIEPELSNRQILEKNVAALPGVVIFNGRVVYAPMFDAVLEVNPINSGCHRMVPRAEVFPGQATIEVPGVVTLEDIVEQMGWPTLDMLKIDCEGCETDVMVNCTDDLLKKTRRIVGEFHFGPENFMGSIGARLQALGFAVTAETNPAAHATFLAVNQNWQEEPAAIDIPERFSEYVPPAKPEPTKVQRRVAKAKGKK